MTPDPTTPGQESAWSYPRPAIAEPSPRRIRILLGPRLVADSTNTVRTLETSHPPSYYIPQADIDMSLLHETARGSICEWKGAATYFDLRTPGHHLRNIAWSYPSPTPAFAAIANHLAFYAAPFTCTVDGEPVTPQAGPFYGGWITPHIAGPFKGPPGTQFW